MDVCSGFMYSVVDACSGYMCVVDVCSGCV